VLVHKRGVLNNSKSIPEIEGTRYEKPGKDGCLRLNNVLKGSRKQGAHVEGGQRGGRTQLDGGSDTRMKL